MRLSIVTPSFNQGQFIGQTIESILDQPSGLDLELIIKDGKSTDNTTEVVGQYRSKLQDRGIAFTYISEKDEGQSDGINKGFARAHGDILTWLNSDDTYLPGALEQVFAYFKQHLSTDVLYGKVYFIDPDGKVIGKYPTEPFNEKRLAVFNFICQPGAFFRRSALERAGGIKKNLHYVMDYELWLRMAVKGARFEYLPEFLATYRLHEASKTVSPAAALANSEETLSIVRQYFRWAPLNRVYLNCLFRVQAKKPGLARKKPALVLFAVLYTLVRYLRLNRGIRLDDLKLFHPRTLAKLGKEMIDIYKAY